jgi:hypothetical protein
MYAAARLQWLIIISMGYLRGGIILQVSTIYLSRAGDAMIRYVESEDYGGGRARVIFNLGMD